MPFPFTLPTTSSTALTDFLNSQSHPSLPLEATTRRSILRDALKKHKRLPPSSQAAHLGTVQEALNGYIPYVLALPAALLTGHVGDETVLMTGVKQLQVEWRLTLAATLPGREAQRARLDGVYNEVAFVLQTLAYVQVQLARVQLQTLYGASVPSNDQRTAAISAAMKHLLEANAIHNYILNMRTQDPMQAPLDTVDATQVALAALSLAEATLIVVLKDDPYTAAVVESRNKESKDWMIGAPSIPKVRAHLFARLCLACAEHAARASASLASGIGYFDESLLRYVDDLRRTARARAARFLAIDAELAGKTGEAIAWLRGARKELGYGPLGEDESKRKGFKGLRQTWAEKREDRRLEKGADDWGMDAGKLEEARVLEWLEAKWSKMNDTINVQAVPPSEPLLASMPSGREYHTQKPYSPPQLDPSLLARLRAPPDYQGAFAGNEADSGDEGSPARDPIGAFPGTAPSYGSQTAYY